MSGQKDSVGNRLLTYGLLTLVAMLMLVDLALIFFWVPTDANLGIVQRVFYFHVAIAWVGYLSFVIVLVGSVLYLWKGRALWDAVAYSAAEIGVVYTTLILVTGSIWARPIWGVWWTWDPRLTTSLILLLIYIGYLMVRAYAPTSAQGARYGAVVGIIGFVAVPVNYLSIVWWRTIHPQPMVGPAAESGSLEASMLSTLLFSLLAFTAFFAFLLRERTNLRRSEDILEQAHGIVASQRESSMRG